MKKLVLQFLLFGLIATAASAQKKKSDDYLLMVIKPDGTIGYKNKAGKMVIPYNKYVTAFTDTFRTFAIVISDKDGIVGIDRSQKVLFKVFQYDNGPDELSEGLFRIMENNKIGYADVNGVIKIKPKYPCAYPFENGKAKVSVDCTSKSDGEHSEWKSNQWFYIDKKGNRIK